MKCGGENGQALLETLLALPLFLALAGGGASLLYSLARQELETLRHFRLAHSGQACQLRSEFSCAERGATLRTRKQDGGWLELHR